jgi:hypothetical protein
MSTEKRVSGEYYSTSALIKRIEGCKTIEILEGILRECGISLTNEQTVNTWGKEFLLTKLKEETIKQLNEKSSVHIVATLELLAILKQEDIRSQSKAQLLLKLGELRDRVLESNLVSIDSMNAILRIVSQNNGEQITFPTKDKLTTFINLQLGL